MGCTRRQWMIGSAGWTAGLADMSARAQPAADSVSALDVLPAEWAAAWPQAQRQGSGRLTVWGLHVYDARLWVKPGWTVERFAQQPLILDLLYARALSGERIADRSLTEMQRSGRVDPAQGVAWLARMKALFPDVKAGDRITGWLVPGEAARFAVNRRPVGDVSDPLFAELFFGIWLSPETSEPQLRRALMGGGTLSWGPQRDGAVA